MRFRDAQRREGLARAAGHDQLAAIMSLEAAGHVVERGLLMRSQMERFVPNRQRFRRCATQIGPVEWPLCEIAEAEHGAGRRQGRDGLRRVRPPLIAGIDDDARGERRARRGRDERIEMRLCHPRARRIALALDGAVAAPAFCRNEINARIAALEIRARLCPLGPQPDVGEPVLVERVFDEVRLH